MGDEKIKPSPAERLATLVGFDPAKRGSLSDELFKEVLEDLTEERVKKAKEAAKEQLEKAVKLREDFDKAEKSFDSQKKKFNKELGKLLNKIESQLKGEAPKDESDDSSGEDSSD